MQFIELGGLMSYKTFHHFLRVLFILLAMLTAMPMNQAEAANPLQRVGDVLQIAVPVYAFGLAMNEQGHEGMKQFAYTLISSQLTVHILKVTTNQKRPCPKKGS